MPTGRSPEPSGGPRNRLTIAEINGLDREGFVERFGGVLEHSPDLAARAWEERPFGGLADLRAAFARAVREASAERRLALVRAHPDLAGKAAVAGELTAESAGEQASAGLDRLTPEEYEAFTAMNRGYREKFGFPMVVCVREHTKASILANAEARLGNSGHEELETAVGEVVKIAHLRLGDLVEDDDRTGPAGGVEGERGG